MIEAIEVGKRHPFGTIPSEGCTLAIGQGLIMLLVLPNIQKSERIGFDHLLQYGIYKSDNFPCGLIIWEFEKDWLIETPFNPLKDEGINDFLEDDSNLLTRVLIDEDGIVRAITAGGLQWSFVKELQMTWSSQQLDWRNYESNMHMLIKKFTTKELWSLTRKYMYEGFNDIKNN
ncbi:MAG: hypothetical protein ACUZ8E_07940 [Candidatus Anammoxibacter sp.]